MALAKAGPIVSVFDHHGRVGAFLESATNLEEKLRFSEEEDDDLTYIMGSHLLFTAPHGIFLERDNNPVHLPESYTSSLAHMFATAVGGSSLTWSPRIINQINKTKRAPDPLLRDPNYLLPSEVRKNVWNRALHRHIRRCSDHGCITSVDFISRGRKGTSRVHHLRPMLHVDVHGRRNYTPGTGGDNSDCDLGLGAVAALVGEEAFCALQHALALELKEVFEGTGFIVNQTPRFKGFNTSGRLTLTQQSVAAGMLSLQLELSLSLRKTLFHDVVMTRKVACAIETAFFDSGLLVPTSSL